MFESSMIQAFLQEGHAAGRLEEAKHILLEIINDRFGSLDPALQLSIDGISDVVKLEELILRARKVGQPEDILTEDSLPLGNLPA